MARLVCIAMLVTLVGCGGGPSGNQATQPMAEQIAEITSAKTNPVSPEQVAEVFALGSDSTDLQRDLLLKDLIGSVVEWNLRVYDIGFADGMYKVTSQPIPIRSKEAVNMLRATISVYPQSERDHEALRTAKTNDKIRIRGKVQDVVLRTAVVIEPAILVVNQ